MSTSSMTRSTGAPPRGDAPGPDRRRFAAVAVVLCAQLMIILDMNVVNVALPGIASGLHFSTTGLSWVLNAYTLTFGGLLLLGGRAGDILGRRRVFIAGVSVFTLASLAGGLATSAGELLAARAAQGVGAAIASPAVLALIVATFPEGRERARAIGWFATVLIGGSSLGLVLGGVIVEWVSWRWVLFINVPIGLVVVLIAPLFVAESPGRPGNFDLPGALTSTAGMTALVYGFIRAASSGWGDRATLAAFAAAVVLLGLFLVTETRASQPITPLRLFADRGRAGSYLARLLLVGGMFGMFFFLTQYVQDVLHFPPLRAGLAFLPMTGALFVTSRVAPRLMARVGPNRLMIAGLIPVVVGMAWLSRIGPDTGYLAGILGPMLLLGGGMGVVFVPLTIASLAGVAAEDSGAASSMVNVMQQVGGTLGLAILVTVFGAASRNAARHPAAGLTAAAQAQHALVHGMARAFTVAAILDGCALLVVALVVSRRRAAAPAAQSARLVGPAAAAELAELPGPAAVRQR